MRSQVTLRLFGIFTFFGILAGFILAQNSGKKNTEPDRAKVGAAPQAGVLPAQLDRLFAWRPIGPANMGGRITSIAVFEADPTCYYVATASGGLLKTTNNGSTFTHLFDKENTVSLGAVAVAPTNRDIVWVGTGEANPRNSVSWGDGVYKSTDGGTSWKNMGLKQSFQIGKIIIHPKNPNIVYVAALGRLYGPNKERGLFKTTDGGKNWQQVWHLDDKTGAIDLVMHPANPETLIMASWERQRDEFDTFVGDAKPPPAADAYAPVKTHAPGGGIFKSVDGGKTWKKLAQGLPRANMGRIGLDWSRKNPNLVVAIIDTDQAGKGLPPSRAYVGIAFANSPKGVRITSVADKSPAAIAKLAKGDLLVSLNGKAIKSTSDFLVPMQKLSPGDKIKLAYQRGDKNGNAEITLALRPGQPKKKAGKGAKKGGKGGPRASLGIQIEESEDGLVLVELVDKAAAQKAGLKVGDVLLAVESIKVGTTQTLFKTLAGKRIGDTVKIVYQRGKEKKTLTVKLEAAPLGTPGRPYSGGFLAGQRANVQDIQGPEGPDTGGIYKSTDAGETWTRVNSLNERPFYFSVVRCDPNDEKSIYSLGINLWRSADEGRTFSTDGINSGFHVDLHDMWINPKDSRHLLLGTDGGLYVSYNRGAHWEFLDHMALGQFYHVAVDTRRPYRVYGGLQDNGSWGGPSNTLRPSGPTVADFQFIQGGDGFVCRVDPNDPDIVYSESQGGNMFRRNLRTGESKSLRPKIQSGAGRYRFNWNTPFILSSHNSHIFYAAANYVFRSVKQGENLRIISPEITRTKHGSATALSESPKDPGVLWVGSDDGAVWVTRDGGKSWTDVSANFKLPGPRWVASIEASRLASGRCYVVFDAHRSDDDEPYVYVTENFGQTWRSLRANLPKTSTRVLREDIKNANLLYLGTEFALFASIDRGESWFKLNGKELPTVAIHEIAQATTANEIVAATHGRSLWVLDVTTLRQLTPRHFSPLPPGEAPARLFTPANVTRWQLDFTREGMFRTGTRRFVGQNPTRDAVLDFLLPAKADKISLRILDLFGNPVRVFDLAKEKDVGIHRVTWNLVAGSEPKGAKTKPFTPYGQPVKPGVYRVVLGVDGTESESTLTIEADPRTRKAGSAVNEAEELRKLMKERP
ncbi:MAG: PDZ domain-containing protein [Planctomycetes bacterium]|nr:PDZ domain-containing protein [Planctomycetota bacterium]